MKGQPKTPGAIFQLMYRLEGGGGWCDVEQDEYDSKLKYPREYRGRVVYDAPADHIEDARAMVEQAQCSLCGGSGRLGMGLCACDGEQTPAIGGEPESIGTNKGKQHVKGTNTSVDGGNSTSAIDDNRDSIDVLRLQDVANEIIRSGDTQGAINIVADVIGLITQLQAEINNKWYGRCVERTNELDHLLAEIERLKAERKDAEKTWTARFELLCEGAIRPIVLERNAAQARIAELEAQLAKANDWQHLKPDMDGDDKEWIEALDEVIAEDQAERRIPRIGE